jgi:hypothetical protein
MAYVAVAFGCDDGQGRTRSGGRQRPGGWVRDPGAPAVIARHPGDDPSGCCCRHARLARKPAPSAVRAVTSVTSVAAPAHRPRRRLAHLIPLPRPRGCWSLPVAAVAAVAVAVRPAASAALVCPAHTPDAALRPSLFGRCPAAPQLRGPAAARGVAPGCLLRACPTRAAAACARQKGRRGACISRVGPGVAWSGASHAAVRRAACTGVPQVEACGGARSRPCRR